jgi:hypothetical protein
VIALDTADLVVIAGRILGVGTDAALDQLDVTAALDALAEARPPGVKFAGRTAAATAGVGLVRALLRHRPFPRQAQQVAVAAGLQFLSLNGWRADLNPPATAAVVSAACSRGPDLPAAPAGGVSAVRPPAGLPLAPADSAYAACMRSHGVAGFAYPAASDVTVPVIGIGLSSAKFSAAEVACQR